MKKIKDDALLGEINEIINNALKEYRTDFIGGRPKEMMRPIWGVGWGNEKLAQAILTLIHRREVLARIDEHMVFFGENRYTDLMDATHHSLQRASNLQSQLPQEEERVEEMFPGTTDALNNLGRIR